MSQAGVGTVIEKLLTDEKLRIRFALKSDRNSRRTVFARFRPHARRDRPLLPDGSSCMVLRATN